MSSFKEWWKSQDYYKKEDDECLAMTCAYQSWNHQQQEIDALKKKLRNEGCQKCGGIILADTEDWGPLCHEHHNEFLISGLIGQGDLIATLQKENNKVGLFCEKIGLDISNCYDMEDILNLIESKK